MNNENKPQGTHILLDLLGCDRKKLNDIKYLIDIGKISAKKTLCEPTGFRYQKTEPTGISLIIIMQRSHIAIHTHPEYEMALIDIYTNGKDKKPLEAVTFIKKELGAKINFKRIIRRGIP